MRDCKSVTFGVIAYNEHNYLPDLLLDLQEQTYPHDLIEVILVDGGSIDDTWNIMKQFYDRHRNEYRNIKLLKNPKRVQPAGWNIVIQNTTSDILIRIDAHARLPKEFIEKNIACINSGEKVCGGPRESIIDEDTPWKRTLLTAEQSMFGAGIASYRHETDKKKYVKSLFHAAYTKDVINKVGLFNEELIRTEDNEYHYRVRKNGYQICYDPQINSRYQTRNSLKRMLRQKYSNGFWIGRTLFICPGCISIFHLVPCGFVFAVILTFLGGACGLWWPAIVLWIAYGLANIGMTVLALKNNRERIISVILPEVFFLLHVSYGVGTINGIVSILVKNLNSISTKR